MKKISIWMLLCMLLPLSTLAKSWDNAEYKQIEQSIRVPQFAQKDYVITKFGAKTDATAAKNQKAIQKAIDKCSKKGGGRVIIQLTVSEDSLTFVYIYDKADMQNVSENFLDQVIKDVGEGRFNSVFIDSPEA